MSLKEDLAGDVTGIISQPWSVRDGTVVPDTKDLALAGGAVKLTATVLYADLADSTELAMNYDRRIAAKVFKCFLSSSSKIIRARGGDIRSFDGDRVMGIFVGDSKNSSAAKCALNINYAFIEIIKPKLEAAYPSLTTGSYKLAHCVGVDTSEMLVIRGGIRNNNDLVWVGRAPNVAAKLSAIRNSPYHSYISGTVYDSLNKESKYSKEQDMWEKRANSTQVKGVTTIYRSLWRWSP
jgi:adenylate cyclase